MASRKPAQPTATSLRLPQDILDRADRLVPKLEHNPELRAGAGEVTRSVVLRLALLLGLDELERRAKGR